MANNSINSAADVCSQRATSNHVHSANTQPPHLIDTRAADLRSTIVEGEVALKPSELEFRQSGGSFHVEYGVNVAMPLEMGTV
jgi:hypothetical protein